MTEPQGRYSSYLLRIWQATSSGGLACRASLEDAHSGERVGFGALDDLFDYLQAREGVMQETAIDANGGAGEQAVGKEVSSPREAMSPSEGNSHPSEVRAEQSSKGGKNERE